MNSDILCYFSLLKIYGINVQIKLHEFSVSICWDTCRQLIKNEKKKKKIK